MNAYTGLFPPFVSNSVLHDGVNPMQKLLCEPEDRLGSQASASVSRPNSMVMQARRSGFMALSGTVDGANFIKAHPFFRDIDRLNIHHYPAPSHPELRAPKIRGTLTLIFLRRCM
ncbi:hypothetical protein B0H14DRAFT_3498530 [Mycena olivaceomarginata]|nr:hypothetical protein B0H14DRAFT_3498530 [Mycena olivaceomarginata]